MSHQNRKRQHLQSPLRVKEEPQEQEENTQPNGAGFNGNANQYSSSNFENTNNTFGTAAAGANGGDDINGLKVKMAALEVSKKK
jgi:hypothetical protein